MLVQGDAGMWPSRTATLNAVATPHALRTVLSALVADRSLTAWATSSRVMGRGALGARLPNRHLVGTNWVRTHQLEAFQAVPEGGLEPPRPKAQVPKTCVSACSTTPARRTTCGPMSLETEVPA